ncbi:MAG: helix-turn-helix domain-containing protein [Thermoplasmata archaeon]
MESNGIFAIMKKLMQNLDLTEAPCTIYSVLAISEKPITIRELAEKTGYSLPMIYSSMRELIENNLVEKIRNEKSTEYIANINFIEVFEKRRKKIMEKYVEPLANLDLKKYPNNVRIREIKEYANAIYAYFMKINELNNR